WKVISVGAGGQEVEAFDSKNPLKVRNLTTLPCSIDENMVLTAESSPYLVNCNVTVEPAATLTIEEGVILLFEAATHLKVEGGFQVNGSKQNPVYIEPVANNGTFDSIVFMQPQHDILINHLMMTDGVIHAQNANVTLNHCELILRNKALVYQNVAYGHYYGNGIFTNSRLIGNHTGQGLEYGWCESVIIENSHFTDIDDPMEFISVYSGYVKNNIAINSNDDGIDFNNCKNMAIEGNQLYNCSDNGVTIGNEFNGPCENILIKNNLIVNCSIGITVKDGSTAVSSRNTLFGNQTGIKLWEKNPGLGGGLLAVENTIISSTAGIVLDIDDISICNLVYTLCDSELLEGAGNLLDDPKFQSATSFNFQLQPDSPCIDAGNPGSQADSDGTVADMGAFFFNQGSFNIVFNEINYKSSSEFDTGDWIELYNPDSIPANISGWEFKDEDDNHVFNIPYGTVIQPGGYLVLCNNSQLFEQKHPDLDCFIGDFEFGLSTNGELLRLFNNTGELIDQVNYGAELPWPEEPNGQGPTLELKNPFLDNSLPESWCASSSYGTPGEVNSCTVYTVVNNDLFPITTAVFPNPATGRTNVKVNHLKEGELTIQVFNSKAEQILNTRTMLHGTGESMIEIKLPSEAGIYLVRYAFIGAADNYTGSVKLLVY
ncbi:MAG: lamin tail domain-containing protein, partial [Bacteroidales bacterium]|nr:lamin tail domain-containing protein [Bacteroidales bacterium]